MSDLLIDSDLNSVISCILNLGEVQQVLRKYGDRHLPQTDPSAHYSSVNPGDQMYWKPGVMSPWKTT